MSSTIVTGQHEYKAQEIYPPISERHKGDLEQGRTKFMEHVNTSLNRIQGEGSQVNEAFAFIGTRDPAGNLHVDYLTMGPNYNKPTDIHVDRESLGWKMHPDEAFGLYSDFCFLCEVMMNEEEQNAYTNEFSVGDINNNFTIIKE